MKESSKAQPDTQFSKEGSSGFDWPLLWVKSGVFLMGLVVLVICLSRPIIIRSHRDSSQTEAVNNARQIGLALFEFETEYGKFPDETTIEKVRKKTKTTTVLGTRSSNDFFRQLLAAGRTRGEQLFYAKIPGARRPDGDAAGSRALEKGEVGFSYLAGLDSAGNPSRPVLLTPLIPGTDRFDPLPFDGKAIVLKLDNSVQAMTIDEDGCVVVFGKNLLDTTNPIWGNQRWKLVWPE